MPYRRSTATACMFIAASTAPTNRPNTALIAYSPASWSFQPDRTTAAQTPTWEIRRTGAAAVPPRQETRDGACRRPAITGTSSRTRVRSPSLSPNLCCEIDHMGEQGGEAEALDEERGPGRHARLACHVGSASRPPWNMRGIQVPSGYGRGLPAVNGRLPGISAGWLDPRGPRQGLWSKGGQSLAPRHTSPRPPAPSRRPAGGDADRERVAAVLGDAARRRAAEPRRVRGAARRALPRPHAGRARRLHRRPAPARGPAAADRRPPGDGVLRFGEALGAMGGAQPVLRHRDLCQRHARPARGAAPDQPRDPPGHRDGAGPSR